MLNNEESSPISRKRSRDPEDDTENLLKAFVHDGNKRRMTGNEAMDALINGDTPFTGKGDTAEAMGALAKAKKEAWSKLSIRETLDWCHTHSNLF